MSKGPSKTNDNYLDMFNSRLQNLILSVGGNILCSLKTMYKVGKTATLEEVKIKEENFKVMLFLLQSDESIYGKLFEGMRKAVFVGIYEYP